MYVGKYAIHGWYGIYIYMFHIFIKFHWLIFTISTGGGRILHIDKIRAKLHHLQSLRVLARWQKSVGMLEEIMGFVSYHRVFCVGKNYYT